MSGFTMDRCFHPDSRSVGNGEKCTVRCGNSPAVFFGWRLLPAETFDCDRVKSLENDSLFLSQAGKARRAHLHDMAFMGWDKYRLIFTHNFATLFSRED